MKQPVTQSHGRVCTDTAAMLARIRPASARAAVGRDPIQPFDPAGEKSTEASRNIQHQGEDDDFGQAHAEGAGHVDTTEGEERDQAVRVKHICEKEERHLANSLLRRLSVFLQVAQPLADGGREGENCGPVHRA